MKSSINKNIVLNTPAITAHHFSKGLFAYPKHIAMIDFELMSLVSGRSDRLIINMPPRHGKSELISKYFPFWYLCNYPNKRIILCSYEANFAQSWSRKVMSLIDEFGLLYKGIKLKPNQQTAGYFEIDEFGGSMTAVGAGGAITGKGADLLIVDDPVKNDEEANSITYRDKIWDWFRSTAYTRLEPDGKVILIMTRWHEDDLCGRILSNLNGENQWNLLKLSAIAGDDDIMGRNSGEAIWEKRFSKDKLMEIKKTIGEYWFNSLYQQSPLPSTGGIFKKKYFRYFTKKENQIIVLNGDNTKIINLSDCYVFATCDLAISLADSADYTVIAVVAVSSENDFFIIDLIRKRVEPAEHLRLLKSVYESHKPVLIGIENVQYQSSLIGLAAIEGLPVKSLRPDTDKLTRALPFAAKIENGKVYFDEEAIWLNDLEHELLTFPKSRHDDQVDALSYLCKLVNPGLGTLPTSRNKRM